MYICPTCKKGFNCEEDVQKHFLKCWKELHPHHKSKSAPRSEDIVKKEINNDIMEFFKEVNNARSND